MQYGGVCSSLSRSRAGHPRCDRSPCPTPKDKDQQQANDCDKRKRHPRSHLAWVELDRKILILSHAYAGRHNDKGILNQEDWAEWSPEEILRQADLGFCGLHNEGGNVESPHKKPRGEQLTGEQKAENRARGRVIFEQAFAGSQTLWHCPSGLSQPHRRI